MFSPEFFKESLAHVSLWLSSVFFVANTGALQFRPWLDQCQIHLIDVLYFYLILDLVLLDSWESCQGADVLLESPSAMAGVHIAEALSKPHSHLLICF